MSYSSYGGADVAMTYRWNVENAQRVRQQEAGVATLPIHLAVGICRRPPDAGPS